MNEEIIKNVIEQKLVEDDFKDCYLVDIEYKQSSNQLTVYIGCDSGMTLKKCQAFSRHIEEYLDESLILGEKYGLDVSSPGVGRPLKLLRQYQNNVGRDLKVELNDGGRKKGELVEVDDTGIHILVKKEKKGTGEIMYIPFDDIKKALVQIKF